MNKGIEILLERMKSNPEEFLVKEGEYTPKWLTLLNSYESVLAPEDVKAVRDEVKKLMQDQFTAEVMKELLDPKSETNPYQPKSVMGLGGATQGGYTLTTNGNGQLAWSNTTGQTQLQANTLQLGQTQLKEEQVKHMIAHLDWLKREEQLKQKEKKSKTLFGRLFNYQ